ncbi:hypothetical protein [Fretibacter rubidus]|uniref:hypothetical protein n=1 Tax=Fretibacter rubidus TaxID=570162 RepID=UPI00352AF4E9
MSAPLWALLGVVIGGLISGVMNYALQTKRFKHDINMFKLKNQSAEVVKSLLTEMLSHSSFTDRSFDALRRPIVGYDDNDVRKFLHEVGAKKIDRDGEEWWYLLSRHDERVAMLRARKAKKAAKS